MKLLLLILMCFPFLSYGQSDTLRTNYSVNDLKAADGHFYVVIEDDYLIKLDSVLIFQIEVEWIEDIVVVKDEKQVDVFGNTPIRAVLIYPKKKYKRKIQEIAEFDKDNVLDD